MEIEYKWDFPDSQTVERLISSLNDAHVQAAHHEVNMHAIYFDTEQHDIARMRGGLRIRRENDASVCCLKLSAHAEESCKVRREFEVDAQEIAEGLAKLPQTGAPRDVCERLLANCPRPICETEFTRQAYTLDLDACKAELVFDVGEMRRDGRVAPIHEIELEFLSGSEKAFHEYAGMLQGEYSLVTQPLSKLARAATL